MATELDIRPSYPLVRTTASKEVARPALPWGTQADLIGVDGSLHGGLRPFHGFEKIYELDFYHHDLHDETSRINYFKPVHFRIGSSQYGYGFVYRAVRSRRLGGDTTGTPISSATVSNTTATGSHSFSTGADLGSSTSSGNAYGAPGKADVFIDFWNSAEDSSTSFGHKGEILAEGVDIEAPMSVVVVGRLIYIFISGRNPALFYVEAIESQLSVAPVSTSLSGSTSSGQSSVAASYSVRKLGTTSAGPFPGPGRQPVLISPHNASPLGTLAVPSNAVLFRRPAVGQVVLTTLGPVESNLFTMDTPGAEGTESISGRGSSSFTETTDRQAGTDSTSIDEVTSDGFGSNYSKRTSSSLDSYNTLTTSSSSSISISQTPPSIYSDPTSSCSATSGTASVGNTPPKILATAWVQSPRPKPPNSSGATATGLLNKSQYNVSITVQARANGTEDPFGPLNPATNRRTFYNAWQLFICDLDDYAASADGPTCLDTPVATGTVPGIGTIALALNVANYVDLKPGHTYLWGLRLFNSNTACGILVGNADEAINPGGDTVVDPTITETDFINNVVGGKYKFRIADSIPANTSASSDDPGVELGKFAAEKYEPGDYVYGMYLYDSKTGRKSAFSEVAQVRAETFDAAAGTSSELSEDREILYMVMELAYDPTKFDQAYIFRSVKVQDAGGTLVAANQHLEAIINLEEYHTNRNSPPGQWAGQTYKHACYWYRLEDKQLIYQDIYFDKSTFDEQMPKGGAATFYGNTMFVSKINDPGPRSTVDEVRPDDAIRGVGETRWSSTFNFSPELFPPSSRYVPSVPTSEMIAYGITGPNCIGFAEDKLYLMRRDGSSFKPQEMHEGYGIVAPKALTATGSSIVYMTSKGLKQITSTGELSDLSVMDYIAVNDWVNQMGRLSLAYDPVLSAIFVHNPDLEETSIIWMNTLMFTQLKDSVFTEIETGVWPSTYTNYNSTLVSRAMFLQNSPGESATDIVTGFKPRIFVVDHDRSRTNGSGSTRVTMLDITGTYPRQLTSGAVSATTVTVATGAVPQNIEGAYVYVMESSDTTFIGKKAKIIRRLGTTTFQIEASSDLVGLPTASRVAISPIFFQWTGANIPILAESGDQYTGIEFNRVRQLNAIGCSFVDVSGPPVDDGTADAKFEALAYRGTGSTPYRTDLARDGDGAIVASIEEYETLYWAAYGDQGDPSLPRLGVRSTSLSPGLRIYCPDLQFRLLSVVTKARILDTERGQRV